MTIATRRRIGLAIIALMAFSALSEIALAQTSPPTDRRVGCVYQDKDGVRFIDGQRRTPAMRVGLERVRTAERRAHPV